MTKLLKVKELNKVLKNLGVYHDLYCKGASDNSGITTEAVITPLAKELSLFGKRIITNSGEELSLGGGPKN